MKIKKYTDKNKWFLVVHAPIDSIVLLLQFIATTGLIILAIAFTDDSTTTLSSGSLYLLMFMTAGLFVQFTVKGIILLQKMLGKTEFKECSPHFVGFFIDFTNEIDILLIVANIIGYMAIEIIVKLIAGEFLFQVAGVAVFLFYIFAAITEETFFRGAIIMVLQTILYKMLGKKAMPVINLICAFVSASIFLLAHTHYLGDMVLMVITFMGGFLQSYIYIKQKSLLSPMISHVLINVASSGSVLQHD